MRGLSIVRFTKVPLINNVYLRPNLYQITYSSFFCNFIHKKLHISNIYTTFASKTE